MTKDNIKKFPITEYQRIRNMQGEFSVPCEISGRWISFDRTSTKLQEGDFISLNIMTMAENDKPKKLCSLIITRENIMEVISKIESKE